MSNKKIVIIGGVAGGATAAARIRRLSEESEIVIFEKGAYISFANCGLPYHIGGTIQERDDLLLQTVDGMTDNYRIDVRIQTEVLRILPDARLVEVINHQTGETYQESYDELIISTGAKAIIPPFDGLKEADNIYTLRNIPDMDSIIEHIEHKSVKTAVVIGGGFIGLEMVENLVERGIETSLVEMGQQVMPSIDYEMAQIIHQQLNLHQVNVVLNDGVAHFENKGHKIILQSGNTLTADLIILAIGVSPESTLAREAGIKLGMRNAIKVSRQFETSRPHIYAIGDAIQVSDYVTGKDTLIPLAWPANRQGRLVADHLFGKKVAYPGTLGTAIAKVFELTVASTGQNEKNLIKQEIAYQAIHCHPNSHASYYPGATPIALKLLFSPDGKILGAQGIGSEGVAKRIDVIATAMHYQQDARSLAGLELAYAPPYSSAKDPVNILGYMAENVLEGIVTNIQWSDVPKLVKEQAFILDVREEFEVAIGKIDGAMVIPLSNLRQRLNELPKDRIIYVYCQVGHRGYNACRILIANGFEVKNIDGGYKTYKQSIYQLTKSTANPNREHKKELKVSSSTNVNQVSTENVVKVDACGLQCPGPILKVKQTMDKLVPGEVLEVVASDFGFSADIAAWCHSTNNNLLSNEIVANRVIARLQKSKESNTTDPVTCSLNQDRGSQLIESDNNATMVVFSGDLDKALASMIIATGAAAMGKEVTMFFTFWGLSILKKENVKVPKKGMAKMFDKMLPKHANRLPISKMNMLGMGSKMIKDVMKKKNVDSLPQMIKNAEDAGVKFVACTMSMDIMGISKDELMDSVEYGGVAAYLGDAEKSHLNLFI
ncbi:CoA-disulfide reductase [Vagococcus intermedius]|uniref:CoA-disulfide reductase n=1 Tax=Vagococcus intermedius TaxID=2991418 RepID=A0AAF0CWH6_9ENTE|nr:CoA-disulfide reductase [Vagococcus intermedius]WEG74106.1 CoA-disulfide reductase [Vagococcus intermedius]WEG76186.1 CoA-disulfide reductase [Vagococcus intermedius]